MRRGVPNSVNLVRCADRLSDACVVERWDCAAGAARFERAASHTLALAPVAGSTHAG